MISKYFAFSTCVLFTSVMDLVNNEQFLNIACLLFLSAAIAAVSAPHPTTVIVHFQVYMHHYNHINFVIFVIRATCIIIYFNAVFVLNLVDRFGVLPNKFMIFWYSIIILLYYYQDQ